MKKYNFYLIFELSFLVDNEWVKLLLISCNIITDKNVEENDSTN